MTHAQFHKKEKNKADSTCINLLKLSICEQVSILLGKMHHPQRAGGATHYCQRGRSREGISDVRKKKGDFAGHE